MRLPAQLEQNSMPQKLHTRWSPPMGCAHMQHIFCRVTDDLRGHIQAANHAIRPHRIRSRRSRLFKYQQLDPSAISDHFFIVAWFAHRRRWTKTH